MSGAPSTFVARWQVLCPDGLLRLPPSESEEGARALCRRANDECHGLGLPDLPLCTHRRDHEVVDLQSHPTELSKVDFGAVHRFATASHSTASDRERASRAFRIGIATGRCPRCGSFANVLRNRRLPSINRQLVCPCGFALTE